MDQRQKTQRPSVVRIGIVSLFALSRPTSGFVGRQRSVVQKAFNQAKQSKSRLFYHHEEQKFQDVLNIPEKEDPAIDALERLLKRQQSEIILTENLLKDLRKGNNNVDFKGSPLSYAASIASGADYGFISRSQGATSDVSGGLPGYGPPGNVWSLGWQQFFRNLDAMRGEYADEEDDDLSPKQVKLQTQLEDLTLNSTAIWEREFANGPIQAPWIIKAPYLVLCWFLDVLFEGRYVPARFFLLETVARMPYFSYITMLHLYETLGFWRRSADVKRIHFAEEINEFRHLLIMESLGGDQQWWVRFVSQHSAIAYFIVLCILWGISPSLSYKFSELLESHAVNTYGQFLDENESKLKKMPPPVAAVEYYSLGASDPFYAEIQTVSSQAEESREIRRPGQDMRTLYDVFKAIQADEGDHVSAMKVCLDPTVALISPSIEKRILTGVALSAAVGLFLSGGAVPPPDLSLDSLGSAVTEGFDVTSLVEGVVAGGAAIASQITPGGDVPVNTVESIAEGAETAETASAIATRIATGVAGLVTGFIGATLPQKGKKKEQQKTELKNDKEAGPTRTDDNELSQDSSPNTPPRF